jgi:hypothetical protein
MHLLGFWRGPKGRSIQKDKEIEQTCFRKKKRKKLRATSFGLVSY